MSPSPIDRHGWKLCALTAIAIVLLALIPQIHFWSVRGSEWNGTYATIQGDEFLYSAYINALIDGRPRRNDPFAGRDSTPETPLPESTFSIQFIPPYVIALVARALGLSASTAFIVLMASTALFATFGVFWLLASVTGDKRLAAAGVFVVLCLGELAGDQGIVGVLLLDHKLSVFMPFLRRYQPAFALPFFFLFCTLVWQALTLKAQRASLIYGLLGGLTLILLVFSYLYLWTAAAAWLACLALLWFCLRPRQEGKRVIVVLAIAGAMLTPALLVFSRLVTGRSKSLDDAQILVFTHQLDLFHTPEMIGALILVALIVGAHFGRISLREPQAIFAASFALLPLIVFNQQVITGRSMQPFHFDLFVMNYVALIGLIVLVKFFWKSLPNRVLVWIAALCFTWGIVEVVLLARARSTVDRIDDEAVPVLLRLKELAPSDGTLAGLRARGDASVTVFSPHVDVMRILPTWTAQGTLLAAGAQDFGTASRKERKELLFLQLYLTAADGPRFRELLNQRTEDRYMNFYAPSVIFGDERFIPELSLHSKPIQQEEIQAVVREYEAFISSVSRASVLIRPIAYLITRADHEPDLSHLDRWYERDAGVAVGAYRLFRLKVRD